MIFTQSSSDFQGVPNIFFNDNWCKLCIINNAIDSKILDAVCRSIGASSFQRLDLIPKSGNKFLTPDYACFGNEENLQTCYPGELNATRCENGYEAYIYCIKPCKFILYSYLQI